jgi:hypothetical protein
MVSEGELVLAAMGLELTAQKTRGPGVPTVGMSREEAKTRAQRELLDAVHDTTEYVEKTRQLRVRKDSCLREWVQAAGREVDLCIPSEHCEYVRTMKRINGTMRPRRDAQADMDQLFEACGDSILYVRDTRRDHLLPVIPPEQAKVLLVIKLFDVDRQVMTLLCSGWFTTSTLLSAVVAFAGDVMVDLGLLAADEIEGLKLKLLEEECASINKIRILEDLQMPLREAKLLTGDVLVVNRGKPNHPINPDNPDNPDDPDDSDNIDKTQDPDNNNNPDNRDKL